MSVTGRPTALPAAGRSARAFRSPTSSPACTFDRDLRALANRAETGKGQHLDLALLDSQVALLAYQNTNYFATGTPPKRIGKPASQHRSHQPFKTAMAT